MKKVILSLVLLTGVVFAKAQTGNNQIGVAVDVGIPTGDLGDIAKTGFGGQVRGLFGVGTAGQVSFTTGYSSHKGKDAGYTLGIIPLLAGYRHNFSGFYVEPQVGLGIYRSKIDFDGLKVTSSESAFTYAVGVGYAMNGIDAGLRYQAGSKDGSTLSVIGIHVGYNFSLGGSSAKK